VWAETPRGKRQPFDRKPNAKGNRILLGRGPDRPPLALPLECFNPQIGEEQRAIMGAIYMPHHATCIAVKEFRERPT